MRPNSRRLHHLLDDEGYVDSFSRQLFKDSRQSVFKKWSSTEKVPSFRNVDGAELTSPTINILEQVSMDRLEMRNIETAGYSDRTYASAERRFALRSSGMSGTSVGVR